jgi:hypothetical protein
MFTLKQYVNDLTMTERVLDNGLPHSSAQNSSAAKAADARLIMLQ